MPETEQTTLDVLRGTRELLSDPSRWTKKSSARDANGIDVSALTPSAVCFCLYGAATRVVGADNELVTAAVNVLREVDRVLTGGAPSLWQDREETTHAEVLSLLDRAIQQEAARVAAEGASS